MPRLYHGHMGSDSNHKSPAKFPTHALHDLHEIFMAGINFQLNFQRSKNRTCDKTGAPFCSMNQPKVENKNMWVVFFVGFQ